MNDFIVRRYKHTDKEKEFYTEGGGNTFEVVWYRKQLK